MSAAALSPDLIEAVNEAAEHNAQKIRCKYARIAERANIHYETVIAKGSPRDVILDTVDKLDIDMLVIANRGHGALKRLHTLKQSYTSDSLIHSDSFCTLKMQCVQAVQPHPSSLIPHSNPEMLLGNSVLATSVTFSAEFQFHRT